MGNELFSLSNKESRVKWSACIIDGQFLERNPPPYIYVEPFEYATRVLRIQRGCATLPIRLNLTLTE